LGETGTGRAALSVVNRLRSATMYVQAAQLSTLC